MKAVYYIIFFILLLFIANAFTDGFVFARIIESAMDNADNLIIFFTCTTGILLLSPIFFIFGVPVLFLSVEDILTTSLITIAVYAFLRKRDLLVQDSAIKEVGLFAGLWAFIWVIGKLIGLVLIILSDLAVGEPVCLTTMFVGNKLLEPVFAFLFPFGVLAGIWLFVRFLLTKIMSE